MDDQLYIVTLAEMKAELEMTDDVEDANLTLWMNGLQERFNNRMNRTLLYGDKTEVIDGGMGRVYLHRYPVGSVASVHLSAAGIFDSTTLLAEGIDYRVITKRGEIIYGLYGDDPWPEGVANIQVTYTGGYYACDAQSVPAGFEMPEDIRLAFMMQFSSLWKNRGNLGVTSKGKDGSTVQYGAGVLLSLNKMTLLADVEVVLDKHMRFV